MQSDIIQQVSELMLYLMRHISVAELLRVPTLKDKLRDGQKEANANALLATYPVMMASDILSQRAKRIPVGEDQVAHIEVAKLLARRFNRSYGEIFVIPNTLQVQTVRILSLDGNGKMSKSNPKGAILLSDNDKEATKKIKKAETAFAGVSNDLLLSHLLMAKSITKDQNSLAELDLIYAKHMEGLQVMGKFKDLMITVVLQFLSDYRLGKEKIKSKPDYLNEVLVKGADVARRNADETLYLVRNALGIT